MWMIVLILIAGLLIRLPFAAFDSGVAADPALLVVWASALVRGGGAELLQASGDMVLYPPLALLGIWAAGALGMVLGGPATMDATALALLKTLTIAGDVALAGLVAFLLRGRTPTVRQCAAAAICFNPAFWYLSAIWGQIDSVFTVLVVAAVASLAGGRYAAAWAAWASGATWKLQALVVAPLVIGATFFRRGARELVRGALVGGGLAIAATAIVFPVERWPEYLLRLRPPESPTVLSGFSAWYLLTPMIGVPDGAGAGFVASIDDWVGFAAVGAVALLVAITLARRPATNLAVAALALTVAPFVLLPGVHERYLIGALPFAVLVAAGWESAQTARAGIVVAAALTATQTLNLMAVGSPLPSLWTNIFAAGGTGPLAPAVALLGYAAAVVNVAVLIWAVRRLTSDGRARVHSGALCAAVVAK